MTSSSPSASIDLSFFIGFGLTVLGLAVFAFVMFWFVRKRYPPKSFLVEILEREVLKATLTKLN